VLLNVRQLRTALITRPFIEHNCFSTDVMAARVVDRAV